LSSLLPEIGPYDCTPDRPVCEDRLRQEAVKSATADASESSTSGPTTLRWRSLHRRPRRGPTPPTELERSMQDVIFIGVTLAFFAVVTLLVKGLERL
jgi:hypothetical protein